MEKDYQRNELKLAFRASWPKNDVRIIVKHQLCGITNSSSHFAVVHIPGISNFDNHRNNEFERLSRSLQKIAKNSIWNMNVGIALKKKKCIGFQTKIKFGRRKRLIDLWVKMCYKVEAMVESKKFRQHEKQKKDSSFKMHPFASNFYSEQPAKNESNIKITGF